MTTARMWPREAAAPRRIPPQIPPLAESLVRAMVCDRQNGEEAAVAEINGHGINGTEKQFGHTNHFTLRSLLAWIAVVGPQRACRAANRDLAELGVALLPLPEATEADPADRLVRISEEVGGLARMHREAMADKHLTAAELARLAVAVETLRQAADAYLSTMRGARS